MIELGELDKQADAFRERGVTVVAISLDDLANAAEVQRRYPSLLVVSDADRSLSPALQVLHAGSSPTGGETSAPTTILVDEQGTIRWVYRTRSTASRLSPDNLLQQIDAHLITRG